MYPQTFAYDDLGNLTQRDSQTYTYTATKPHAVRRLGVDGTTDRFVYDAAGNMTRRGSQSLSYDAEERLTRLSGPTGTETTSYDGDGAILRRASTRATSTLWNEGFDSPNIYWSTSGTVAWGVPDTGLHTSTFRATGAGTYTPVINHLASIADGQVARVAFKLSQTNSGDGIEIDSGTGSGYYRIAIYENLGKLYQAIAISTGSGTNYVNPAVLVDNFQANHWYVLELAVDDAAGCRVTVWDENAPSVRYEARYEMPTGRAWRFRAWAFTTGNQLWLDDYQESQLPSLAPTSLFSEGFGSANAAWSTSGTVAWGAPDGAVHPSTFRATGASSWTPVIGRTATIADGQVTRVAFKLSQINSQDGIELDTGSGLGYYRIAVYENGGKLYQAVAFPAGGGISYVNPAVLVDSFQAGHWYVLEVAADDGAGVRVTVWDEDVPSVRYQARWDMPTGKLWTFRAWVYTTGNQLWLDTYQEERSVALATNVREAGKHYEVDATSGQATKRYYAGGVLLPFFGAFAIQCCTMPVLLALQAVYLAHIILDRPGSDAVRVLLGLGLFFFPMVAMPLYFLLYIWPGRPPATAIQPAPLT